MKLIIGLGNPGKQYEQTRHNIGFMVIDELSDRLGISINQEKCKGLFGSGMVHGEKVYLLKPMTYMNLSGECIRGFMDYFKIPLEDVVIIYDDLDLTVGKLRLRQKGSAGGHNGIKSTIAHLGTQEFNRIRIGVDRPSQGRTVIDHVLGNFSKEEKPFAEKGIEIASEACEKWLSYPFLEVMNMFNQK